MMKSNQYKLQKYRHLLGGAQSPNQSQGQPWPTWPFLYQIHASLQGALETERRREQEVIEAIGETKQTEEPVETTRDGKTRGCHYRLYLVNDGPKFEYRKCPRQRMNFIYPPEVVTYLQQGVALEKQGKQGKEKTPDTGESMPSHIIDQLLQYM